eukprot:CAMPEP_0178566784 /NCGR_PEP_ID=MMETSP0697-20121206/14954_1 /TAXON_ID=265572 /ORGANISM="Extubocellulus spinifer, Strain CCMP396" /LENGTH=385 /DNA_ID=CAMNT_0020200629 /DNA_START=1 /DNA_END=1155 /DNA_ORIENTATION=+
MGFIKGRKGKQASKKRSVSTVTKREKKLRHSGKNVPMPNTRGAAAAAAAAATASAASSPADLGMSHAELKQMGVHITQEQLKIYCFVAYHKRFGMPNEEDWNDVAKILANETGRNPRSIKDDFEQYLGGKKSPPERKGGSGRKSKLDKSNKGLKAAAVLLNLGMSPQKAVEMCNKMNKEDHPDDFDSKYKISAKTLVYTIKKYSTVMLSKTLRRKTGSRDTNSKWAIARLVEAKQIIDQLKLGKKMDVEQLTWEQIRRDYSITPIWSDGILSVDEGHCKAHLSGGHTGSTNTLQYRVGMDPTTGDLAKIEDGGQLPERKVRVKPKFSDEARGAYGVGVPTKEGKRCPTFMDTYDYTKKKLVGYKKWCSVKTAEQTYRRGTVYKGW